MMMMICDCRDAKFVFNRKKAFRSTDEFEIINFCDPSDDCLYERVVKLPRSHA
jgi:hypothetical protein